MSDDLARARRLLRIGGTVTLAALLGVATVYVLALKFTPIEASQGAAQKIFYLHVPAAWGALVAFSLCGIASAAYLFLYEARVDRFAASSAEVGLAFSAVMLTTGPIWGKPIWGTWWDWDPRLTLTLLLFLLFLGFTQAYNRYQTPLILKEGLLVGFFLAGLVVLGGMQQWWLQPVISGLEPLALFFGAVALTAITDNAALTYLGSLIVGMSDEAKYMLVAGAVAGGGLTVIANAPNPAGVALLLRSGRKAPTNRMSPAPSWSAAAALPCSPASPSSRRRNCRRSRSRRMASRSRCLPARCLRGTRISPSVSRWERSRSRSRSARKTPPDSNRPSRLRPRSPACGWTPA